jgi:hypothetical protein
MEDLAKQYSHLADFVYVYIKEAHADDEWQVEKNRVGNVIFNTFEERLILAEAFQEAMGTETTILVDDISNTANAAYAAWPERIYVIDPQGKIVYKGGMGPFYFDPDEIVPVLDRYQQPGNHRAATAHGSSTAPGCCPRSGIIGLPASRSSSEIQIEPLESHSGATIFASHSR